MGWIGKRSALNHFKDSMPGKRTRAPSSSRMVQKKARFPLYNKAPLLERQRVVFRYFLNEVQLNPAAGVPGVRIFRANGCFDPEASGAGHQPRGFDQLMALYEKYTVIKSTINVDFAWRDEVAVTAKKQCTVGISLMNDSTALLGNNFDYQEDGYTNYKCLAPSQTNAIRVSNSFTPSFLGHKNPLSENSLSGSVTADPLDQAFFHVFATPTANEDTDVIGALVYVEYVAILSDPQLPTAS